MMNRILKRPMFRMGGRSDDGIMSVRSGYENGGPLTTPDPANGAACDCNASCAATVGANLEVSTGIAVAAVNCFA